MRFSVCLYGVVSALALYLLFNSRINNIERASVTIDRNDTMSSPSIKPVRVNNTNLVEPQRTIEADDFFDQVDKGKASPLPSHNAAFMGITPRSSLPTSPRVAPQLVNSNVPLAGNPRLVGKERYAFVTLIHGVDDTFAYRGYLISSLVMRKALKDLGSKADFVALIGFTSLQAEEMMKDNNNSKAARIFQEDVRWLSSHNIKVHYLRRIINSPKKIRFAEMALLKVVPWSLIEYDFIQYMDGDVFPTRNMDCYFNSTVSQVFNTGAASPLNSGWFVARTSYSRFQDMLVMAENRLLKPWNETIGWGRLLPESVQFRGWKRRVPRWSFNGASLDQGLLFDYFALQNGGIALMDESGARIYDEGYEFRDVHKAFIFPQCQGREPLQSFAHFTGRKKPWLSSMLGTASASKQLKLWGATLDSLGLPINSTNLHAMGFKPPLGFWHPNK